jgi:carboxyl-terminal processing protease
MKKIQVWLPLLFAIVMIGGMGIGYTLRERIPAQHGLFQAAKRSSVQEVMDLIRMKYVDTVNIDSLSGDAINAMLAHLDPHSVFIPAINLRDINEDLQGNFQGIGVEFQIISDTVHVASVLPDGPSDKAGLRTGDRFIKVGDSVVAGTHITPDRIKNLLRGPGGSRVLVTLMRRGATMQKDITRGTIPLASVDASYMLDPKTGYIHLSKFSGTSYVEFMQALEKLQKLGMQQLVFDLRDNGGGILGEAVDIADEFLGDDKLIVFTQGTRQRKTEFRAKRPGLFEKGKLILLINEGSASASEVVAGALQDWDRATLIGRRTFGKGLVQEQFELSDGSALRLTVARYYTPTGRSIQKPYTAGRDAYNEEVLERYHSGELIYADSVKHPQGPQFKTKGGRIVYGGGGITPDIFVPFDTTGFSTDISPLFYNQAFAKFIYTYYIDNQDKFSQFKSPSDFANRFDGEEAAFAAMMEYMKSNSIKVPDLPEKDKIELKRRIKIWLARQMWRSQGFFEVSNMHDKTVQRAMEELNK